MKKLLALLLAAAMLLTLAACGKKDKTDAPAVDLTGTWTMTLRLNALLDQGSMQGMDGIFQLMNVREWGLTMTTDVTFQDGKMTVEPTGLVNFYQDLFDAMENWLTVDANAAAFDDYCQKNDLDKDRWLQQITGDLPAELANELVHKMGDALYEVNGNKLHTWNTESEKDPDGYFQFYLKDDTITVHKVVENGQTTELNDGDFVFKKK